MDDAAKTAETTAHETADPAAQDPAPSPEETAAADAATQPEDAASQLEQPPADQDPAAPSEGPAQTEEAKAADKAAAKAAAKEKAPAREKAPVAPAERPLTDAQLDALAAAKATRWGLYKQQEPATKGWVYAAAGGPPFHDDQVINTLADRGLLLHEPTGGNHGSAKLSEAGLEALRAAGRL